MVRLKKGAIGVSEEGHCLDENSERLFCLCLLAGEQQLVHTLFIEVVIAYSRVFWPIELGARRGHQAQLPLMGDVHCSMENIRHKYELVGSSEKRKSLVHYEKTFFDEK